MLLALAYAPISLSSMWFAFLPGAPRLQERLDAWVAGEAYATGSESLSLVRTAEYVDHRVLLLVHTMLGGVALVLAAWQLVAARRATRRTHRSLGLLHLGLVTVSMVAAIAFLLISPVAPGFGQTAFRWQLWVLALSTLGTAWLSAVSARRRDIEAHRAWLTLNLAFLLTAPLLRLLWTLLAAVLPGQKMLTNIETGAVFLAVAAPTGAAIAFIVGGGRDRTPSLLTTGTGLRGPGHQVHLVAVAAAGAWLLFTTGRVVDELGGYVWFHVVPIALCVAVCLLGIERARHRGSIARARAWATLLRGISLSSWMAVGVGLAAVALQLGFEEGVLAGLMVGPGFPVAASLAHLVRAERVERVE